MASRLNIDDNARLQAIGLLRKGDKQGAIKLLWNAGLTKPEELQTFVNEAHNSPQLRLGNVDVKELAKLQGEHRAVVAREFEARNAPKAASSTGKQVSVGKKPPPIKTDPLNDQFGHDMAWLDPLFKAKPELLGKAARSEVFADPALVAKQNQALDSLFGIARDGGASAQERARRQGARRDSENWLRGQREADMENLSERGMSGSGAEILALGKDRQDAAQRNSDADLQTDAWLEQRALDAMMQGGELAGKMRDTGFREGQERAGATDEWSLINTQAINGAETAYKEFQQRQWADMIKRRNDWELKKLELGVDAAGGLLGSDARQNDAGYTYAKDIAKTSTGEANRGRDVQNEFYKDPNKQEQDAILDEETGVVEGAEDGGAFVDKMGETGMSGGGGMGGVAGGGSTFNEDEGFGG
jgi:hypothetical protein